MQIAEIQALRTMLNRAQKSLFFHQTEKVGENGFSTMRRPSKSGHHYPLWFSLDEP